MSGFENRLGAVADNPDLSRLQRGVEREALRILPDGSLSNRSHPTLLGSPLTHRSITTDFAEAQLELITGTHTSAEHCYEELLNVHRFVASTLEDELLWPASMPCGLGAEETIKIAEYGRSNAAKMKEVYRSGLAHRYGRVMQTISGIHYNFSLPDSLWEDLATYENTESSQSFQDSGYLRLSRNFRLHGWFLLLLFGASPMVCRSFLRNNEHNLQVLDETTGYLPYATSLRMGPLGYQSADQAAVFIDHNSLSGFAESLLPTLTETHSKYQTIGILKDGEFLQLNDALLQIEAEYYGTIRIKRKTQPAERALLALKRRGIEYVEVRCVDIDPFEPVGISVETMRFLDIFLLHCLLSDNEGESKEQAQLNLSNQLRTVHEGLDSNTQLKTANGEVSIREWAQEILADCLQIASKLDQFQETPVFTQAVESQSKTLNNLRISPSARLQKQCRDFNQSFSSVGLELAREHMTTLIEQPLSDKVIRQFKDETERSNTARETLENAESETFESYLKRFLSMAEFA